MKAIFKSLSVVVLLLAGVTMSAQNLTYEVTAGVGFSKYTMTEFLGMDLKGTGFRVGAVAECPIPQVENLYASAGAIISLENAKVSLGDYSSTSMNPFFLNIPIHVGYKYTLTDQIGIFGEVGPYAGIGLFGKSVYTGEDYDGTKYTEKEDVFGDDGALSRFQFGLGVKVGVVVNEKYKVHFGWDCNLLNSDSTGETKVTHNNAYLGVSYMF